MKLKFPNFKNLNFIKVITRDEPVGGLEINDVGVRAAFLELPKNETGASIKFLLEEPLPEGVVVNGQPVKPEILVSSLKKLASRMPVKIKHVIASVQNDLVYLKTSSFPANIHGEKLENSVRLAINFQMPQKPEEVYTSWENIGDAQGEKNQMLLASCPKKTIDAYSWCLIKAGLNPIAIEFQAMSLGRLGASEQTKPLLLKILNQSSTSLVVLRAGGVLFNRVLPEKYSTKQFLNLEIEKIKNFFDCEGETISAVLEPQDIPLPPAFAEHPELKIDKQKWLASLGAALRGLLPKGHDDLLSLMPIGTKQAYELQKAAAFSAFIRNLAVSMSVFFIAAFLGTWLFMLSLQKNTLRQLDILNALPPPPGGQSLENRAESFNAQVATINNLLKSHFDWTPVITEISNRTSAGITITELNLGNPSESFSLKGSAATRQELNDYKKSLESSNILGSITIPLANLEQKSDIPFSVSFQLKNPQAFYFH